MALLSGVRVLDFGRFIAGPYCAALLGDLGADVIRIERVEGGEDRYVPQVTDGGEGGLYLQMNRNKRGLTLDPTADAGRQIVRRLVGGADVVVANLPPATLRQWGLDYATLQALNPRIVLATGSAYGPGGPYSERPGFDAVGQSISGVAYLSGQPDAPVRAAAPYVDVSTAQALAMGTLAALWSRERSGHGQHVEGSLLRSALIINNAVLIEQAVTARDRVPQGNRGFAAAPSDLFRARDGWLVVQTIGQPMFERWCRLIGRPELVDDPRFADDDRRGDHSADISALMAAWCATRSRGAGAAGASQAAGGAGAEPAADARRPAHPCDGAAATAAGQRQCAARAAGAAPGGPVHRRCRVHPAGAVAGPAHRRDPGRTGLRRRGHCALRARVV